MLITSTDGSNGVISQSSNAEKKFCVLLSTLIILSKLSHNFQKNVFRQLYPITPSSVSKTKPGRSKVTQVTVFLDSVYKTSDISETLYACYLDPSKDFD